MLRFKLWWIPEQTREKNAQAKAIKKNLKPRNGETIKWKRRSDYSVDSNNQNIFSSQQIYLGSLLSCSVLCVCVFHFNWSGKSHLNCAFESHGTLGRPFNELYWQNWTKTPIRKKDVKIKRKKIKQNVLRTYIPTIYIKSFNHHQQTLWTLISF